MSAIGTKRTCRSHGQMLASEVKQTSQLTARMSANDPKRISIASRNIGLLVLPEPFEPIGCQGGVADGRCDRTMSEIVLDRPRVLAVVCEFVPARMPQHVRVDEERETSGFASPRNHALIAGNAQRRQALGHEDIDATNTLRHFPLQDVQQNWDVQVLELLVSRRSDLQASLVAFAASASPNQ
jgi:hypothetical protein